MFSEELLDCRYRVRNWQWCHGGGFHFNMKIGVGITCVYQATQLRGRNHLQRRIAIPYELDQLPIVDKLHSKRSVIR